MVIASGSLFMTGCSALLISRKLVNEPFVFLMMASLGACGAILFFDFHLPAPSLLLADVIVYGGASIANGIGEGWACRAATQGTSYSIEVYRLHSTAGVCIARFLGPVVARFYWISAAGMSTRLRNSSCACWQPGPCIAPSH